MCRGISSAIFFISLFLSTSILAGQPADLPPELSSKAADLTVPETTDNAPAPGRRVRQWLPRYQGTQVYHVLYLPTNWKAGERYPVIVEYAGNGSGQTENSGDVCSGLPESSNLGYGVSGGKGFLWVCVPYVDKSAKKNAVLWFGDVPATIDYCLETVRNVCEQWGGDPGAVFVAGFSRGAMACNYIGLHNDRIADVWLGFIPYSFYDGLLDWKDFEGADKASALERLKRLRGRASCICEEKKLFGKAWTNGTNWTRNHLTKNAPADPFTYVNIPYRNHNDAWVLRDISARKQVRDWVADVLKNRPGTHSVRGRVTDARGHGLAGVRVESGETHWTVTGPDGSYTVPSLVSGPRTVRIHDPAQRFDPSEAKVTLSGHDVEHIDFKAIATQAAKDER